jgi:hypothetical protein
MLRFVLLAAVLAAGTSNAQALKTRVSSALLGLSQAAPTGTPLPQKTDGTSSTIPGALRITGCTGYRIMLCATSGSISATGTLQIYYWSDYFGTASMGGFMPSTWPRNKQIDETVPTTVATDCAGSACQCIEVPDRWTPGPGMGWIYVAPASVTTTGAGTTVRVTIEATCAY